MDEATYKAIQDLTDIVETQQAKIEHLCEVIKAEQENLDRALKRITFLEKIVQAPGN